MKPTRLDEVRAWVQKAQNDLLSARILLEHKPPILDTAAFHCQQAVEKGLKAFLVWKEVPFEKVHSLPLTPLHFLDHSNPPASAACSSALRSSGGLACSTSCKASLREVLSSPPSKVERRQLAWNLTSSLWRMLILNPINWCIKRECS
jgi:hypothetical protein